MALSQNHRSHVKQRNKAHRKIGHRSKREIKRLSKGRISVQDCIKKIKKDLGKRDRRHQSKQIRNKKKEAVITKKKEIGTARSPPFHISVIPLSLNINPLLIVNALKQCDASTGVSVSSTGITHINCLRFKQRFSFFVPPVDDLCSVLDCAKICDIILFLWPVSEELDDGAELLLSCIKAQGLPSVIHILTGLDELPHKKKHQYRQQTIKDIESHFSGYQRVLSLEKEQDPLLLLRQIGAQKRQNIFYRDTRAHVIAEDVNFCKDKEGLNGTLKIKGYIRSQPLSVNGLVHICGWGDFQMSCIDVIKDQYPLDEFSSSHEVELISTFEADPSSQVDLIAENEIDIMEGEQTWPTKEEIQEAEEQLKKKKTNIKRVPKGTSEYQAAWILDLEDEENMNESEDIEEEISDFEDAMEVAPEELDQNSQSKSDAESLSDEEDYEELTVSQAGDVDYDEQVDYSEDMEYFEKMKAAKEDAVFPDELDTPQDIHAHVRFQKYRGLQSFRTSVWDSKENLPIDYARVFQFGDYKRSKKKILKDDREGALPGWYVVLHVKNVQRQLYESHLKSHSPLVIFGILPHEHRMSVLNFAIKSHSSHFTPIKSKEKLIFHVGYRRFANCPIFSEHALGNKFKFVRYFQPGSTVVATMFAPIIFSPASVLVFQERSDGIQDLVATGSIYSIDPDRIVCKRVVLSGHPFKVNKRSAVVRYMFFNREDILWFKPVELHTKWGRRGHIKEPLGTHGHMKCQFNGQLKSQDTVLMNLYKRVFPKWTYNPVVPNPLHLFSYKKVIKEKEDEEEEKDILPKAKKARTVHFSS